MKKLIAGGCLIALAACGSATDSVTFTAPAAYTSKASLGPFMQVWGGKTEHDVLILLALPVVGDLKQAVNKSQVKGAQFEAMQQITICDNQPAIFALGHGDLNATNDSASAGGVTVSTGTKDRSTIEIIATQVKGKTYLAIYGRPLKAPADPEAEKAIKNVCPK